LPLRGRKFTSAYIHKIVGEVTEVKRFIGIVIIDILPLLFQELTQNTKLQETRGKKDQLAKVVYTEGNGKVRLKLTKIPLLLLHILYVNEFPH